MPQFHKLTVTDVRKTIRDAVVVNLMPEDPKVFDFIPGQYLTFRRDFGGTELRRSYSISAGRDEGLLQVGIKKVAGGAFSTWANEHLTAGMALEAMAPAGTFHTPIQKDATKSYIAFAGGSGITPILSLLKTILKQEPESDFTLVYANRGVHSIMFREEIEDLKNTYIERLNVIHILGGEAQDMTLFNGRIDQEKCAALFENWIDIQSIDTAFICGPEPMMQTIRASLKDHGLKDDQIKYELFASGQAGRLARPSLMGASQEASKDTFSLTMTLDGTTQTFESPKTMTVLDAALSHAQDTPFACKAGVCSTCKCKVLQGEVEMVANHALEDYEVRQGYILSCQSFALGDTLIVDYDHH